MTLRTVPEVQIRAYEDDDEAQVLALLRVALGEGPTGERSARFFHWKHLDGPFGRSFLLVAESDGRIVGLRAFMRWRFRGDAGTIEAARAVDTATHPDFQRMGIFSRLTRAALEDMRGNVDLIFNTPNHRSLPGYLKMGWRVVGKVPVAVRVMRPMAAARALGASDGSPPSPSPSIAGDRAADVLEEAEGFDELLTDPHPDRRWLSTPKDLRFLRWRYARIPNLDYRAVTVGRGGRCDGLAVYRLRARGRSWELSVSETIARPGDGRTVGRLLAMVTQAASAHHAVVLRHPGVRTTGRHGFVPLRSPMTLVVKPLRDGLAPDPTVRDSWGLSLGDVEVF